MSRFHFTNDGWRGLWVFLLLSAGSLGTATRAMAQAPDTHLEVPANRMVNLVVDFGGDDTCPRPGSTAFRFVRVRPNGNKSPETFIVPANQVFVLTDVTWRSRGRADIPFVPGRLLVVWVQTFPESNFGAKKPVHELPGLVIPPGGEGINLSGSQHLTAGVKIAGGHGLCLAAIQTTNSTFVSAWIETAHLQGYTVPLR